MRNVMVKTIFSVPESHTKAFQNDSEIHKLLISFARVQKAKPPSKTPIKPEVVKSPSPEVQIIKSTKQPVSIVPSPKNSRTARLRQRQLHEFCVIRNGSSPKVSSVVEVITPTPVPKPRPSKILRNVPVRSPTPVKEVEEDKVFVKDSDTIEYPNAANVDSWALTFKKRRLEGFQNVDYHSPKSSYSDYIFPISEDREKLQGLGLKPDYIHGNKCAEIFVRQDLRFDYQTSNSKKRRAEFLSPIPATPLISDSKEAATPNTSTRGSSRSSSITPSTPFKRRKTFTRKASSSSLSTISEDSSIKAENKPKVGPKNKRHTKSRITNNNAVFKVYGTTEQELLDEASKISGFQFKEIKISVQRLCL